VDITEQIVTALIDHWALIAGLVIVAVWTMKTFFPGFLEAQKKSSKQLRPLIVQLDPATSQMIQQTGEAVKDISTIIHRTDAEGMPLVYADRRTEQAVLKITEALRELYEAQRRLADTMSNLDARFAAHDRADAITFAKLTDSQERIEAVMNSTRDSLILFEKDAANVLKVLDEIKAIFAIQKD
jgi:hypothetical protein